MKFKLNLTPAEKKYFKDRHEVYSTTTNQRLKNALLQQLILVIPVLDDDDIEMYLDEYIGEKGGSPYTLFEDFINSIQ